MSTNAKILGEALRELTLAWDANQLGWYDKARADFEHDCIVPLRLTVKGAMGAMSAIGKLLDRVRRECE